MPDFSYQALINALAPQFQSPTPLVDGLAQPPGLTPLQMMQAKQFQDRLSNTGPRDINPGVTWNGQDRNAVQPNDVITSRTFGVPENI